MNLSKSLCGAKPCLVAALSYFAVGQAEAIVGPLDLALFNTPDLAVQFAQVSYDAGADTLTINGLPSVFELDELSGQISPSNIGTFSLSASIDEFGALSSGSFIIDVDFAGIGSGIFLTGDITDFGADATGGAEKLEFLFDVTGGYAASIYGESGGMIMTETGYQGTFSENWNNNIFGPIQSPFVGDGLIDVANVVPEPSEYALMLGLLLSMLPLFRKRFTQNTQNKK